MLLHVMNLGSILKIPTVENNGFHQNIGEFQCLGDPYRKEAYAVFWNMRGPVHWELLKPNASITSDLFCTQLINVNNAIRVLRALGRREGPVFFQMDNARPHTSAMTL